MTKKYLQHRSSSFFKIKSPRPERSRLTILLVFFIILGVVITGKLASLQILDYDYYDGLASGNHEIFKHLLPKRGEIYARDPYSELGWHKIAVNQDLSVVYVNPWKIKDINDATTKIAPFLDLDLEAIKKKLEPQTLSDGRKISYVVLKRKITSYEQKAIEELDITGIGFTKESWRYYPDKDYTAHLTGFLGMSDNSKVGQYGLEGYFNNELTGTQGYIQTDKDASGNIITIGNSTYEAAKDGENIYLTIDKNVQFYACEELRKSVEEQGAKEGTVIIMQPQTGAIIASCSYPSYDPNEYSEVDSAAVYLDKALVQYEPGSVFKTFTIGAALDMGKITPYTTYNDTGEVWVEGYPKPIKNSHGSGNGIVDMNYVLEQSLNTGSVFAVQQVGNEAWYDYVVKFGFGEKTGIELAGENQGNISSLEEFKDIYSATASFGQGITVSPLQLINAFAAIANGGKLMKPYIVAEYESADGSKNITQPQIIRQVISSQTAQTLSAMLVNVVDNGTAKKTSMPDYYIGGKTGTAQIPLSTGGYDANRHKDTFVGYAPISNPQFVMLVKIDEPQTASWAEGSTVPLWKVIAKYMIDYYKIPPDRN